MAAKKRVSAGEKKCMSDTVLSVTEQKRHELIITIQDLYKRGESIQEITCITGKDYRTVKKYLKGDPDLLCKSNKRSPLASYTDFIINHIMEGQTVSELARQLQDVGFHFTHSNIRHFITKVAKEHGLKIAKYCHSSRKNNKDGEAISKMEYITRKGIFNHLWMNIEITRTHRDYLWMRYDVLPELDICIRKFREIFDKKSMPCLYMFIEHYSKSGIEEIASFANSLSKDIKAVENAVASPLSNGFVEGSNSKLKTIKKAMYGRCGKPLLEAKLMYEK